MTTAERIQKAFEEAMKILNTAYSDYEDLRGGTDTSTDRLEVAIQDLEEAVTATSLILANY